VCPADDLSNSISSTISNDDTDRTVVQTTEELQLLALGSLKQVIYFKNIYIKKYS